MIINIHVEELIMILLNGDIFSSRAVPLTVGEWLKNYDPEEKYYHIEHPDCAKFCEFWSIDGWKNELKRREYIVQFHIGPKVKSKEDLIKELAQAVAKGNVEKILELNNQISKLS